MPASFALDGRSALVTGASRGLGQAMAVALAEAGADVAGVATGNLDETKACVEATGRRFTAIVQDLRGTEAARGAVEEAARGAVEEAAGAMGRLDILVNNAGIIPARTRSTSPRPTGTTSSTSTSRASSSWRRPPGAGSWRSAAAARS
jgi:NAD(P)-dependent dehydrogenase (short-subunit alcohol dehydrogenase family)